MNDWLGGIPESSERVALVSLAFNGIVSPGHSLKLREAIVNGDRAEAWYEIRYQSNGGKSRGQGIANRRYIESDTFSLYNSTPTTDDFKSAYRMFTRHANTILDYPFTDPTKGNLSSRKSIEVELIAAYEALIAEYVTNRDIPNDIGILEILVGEDGATLYGIRQSDDDTLNGNNNGNLIFGESGDDIINGFQGSDVLYGGDDNDILNGGTENDYLFGEAGNDTLVGAEGADRLEGGQGLDTYIAEAGDTILDRRRLGPRYI